MTPSWALSYHGLPECRSDYFPSSDPDSQDDTLRLVDHHSTPANPALTAGGSP